MIPRAAEIVASEIQRHELRAHGAVEDEDAFLEQAQVMPATLSFTIALFRPQPTIGRADLSDRESGPIIHDWPRESSEFHRCSLVRSAEFRSAAIVDGPRARPAPSRTLAA